MSIYNDGRRQSQRVPRKEGHCTACGKQLPESVREWGLVWDARDCGICVTCVVRIRSAVAPKISTLPIS